MTISHSELSSHEETLRNEFEAGETLAHTLAYDKFLRQPTICSTDPRYIIKREDTPDNKTTTVMFGDAKDLAYIVSTPTTCDGLVCYILTPTNANNNIKVIFRGTGDKPSALRDIEYRSPGTETFAKSKDNILKALNNVIKEFPENTSLTLYGHSLGGSDAQNCFVAIMEAINKSTSASDEQLLHDEKNSNQFFKINALTLMAYNPAGVTADTATQANQLARQLKAKHNIKLTCFWQLAAGDGVQQSGEASILAGIDSDIATVYLRKVWYENTKENSWQTSFNPIEIVSAATHTIAAHTKHSSGPKASPSRDEIYSNIHSPRVIHDKLTRKSPVLQSFVVQSLQAGLHLIGRTILQPHDCNLSDSMYAEPFVVVSRPSVTVEDVTHEPEEPASSNDASLALIIYEENPLNKLKATPSALKITSPDTPNKVDLPATIGTSVPSIPAPAPSMHLNNPGSLPAQAPIPATSEAHKPTHVLPNDRGNISTRENISFPPNRRHEISMIICMLAAVTIALAVGTYGVGLLVGIAIAGFVGGGILSQAYTWLSKTCCSKTVISETTSSTLTSKPVIPPKTMSSRNIFSRLGCLPCLIAAPQNTTQHAIVTPPPASAIATHHLDSNTLQRKCGG